MSQTAHDLNSPAELLAALQTLESGVRAEAAELFQAWGLDLARPEQGQSLQNLAAYLALRHRDLRPLQTALRPWGLSSLGRIEAQVLLNLAAVIATLGRLCTPPQDLPHPQAGDFLQGQRNLQAETELIFGPPPVNRRVRMMVTLDSDCANDPARVRHMLLRGMNIARINCAHDGPPEWARMIGHLRAAQNETGLACRVAMDLGGPKARTAQLLQSKGHLVKPGDTLLLVPQTSPHSPYPVQVACSLPEILPQLRVGAQVWFDDGLIGTVITAQAEDGWLLTVTQAAEEGDKLKADKGINFPDTHLQLDPLTAKDLADLDFVVAQADMVNYSFVQTAQDVARLEAEIEKRRPGSSLGLVAKIETRAAVENLPAIIAAASSQRPLAIMIARGDLAVEIGFERLAEMQEEILWICEAAHTPVIWATQVLENLAKHGRPSRAEMTDAAMSERAECVMLNKGRYILEAISTLDQVLERMQDHQSKKSAQLRALKSW